MSTKLFIIVMFVLGLLTLPATAGDYGREWLRDRDYVASTYGRQIAVQQRTVSHVQVRRRTVTDGAGNIISQTTDTTVTPVRQEKTVIVNRPQIPVRTGYYGSTGYYRSRDDCRPRRVIRRDGCYSVPRRSGTSVRIGVQTDNFSFGIGYRNR